MVKLWLSMLFMKLNKHLMIREMCEKIGSESYSHAQYFYTLSEGQIVAFYAN